MRQAPHYLGRLAQLVEQRTFNPWVTGSSPVSSIAITLKIIRRAYMDRFLFFPLAARFVLLVIMLIPLLISGLTLAVYQNEVPQEERAPFWTTALSGLAVTNMVMVVCKTRTTCNPLGARTHVCDCWLSRWLGSCVHRRLCIHNVLVH